MAQWYVQKTNPENEVDAIGPLRPSELLEMVRKGEVLPKSKVRKGDSKWFDAADVGGLFQAATRPNVLYFCPQCDTQVTQPPVTCPSCLHDVRKAREETTENPVTSNDPANQPGRSVKNWLKNKVKRPRET